MNRNRNENRNRDDPTPGEEPSASGQLAARTARLAKLDLSPDEARLLGPQLARMLETFGTLSELDLSSARADAGSAAGDATRVRQDEPRPSLARDALLAGAPEPIDAFYGVPKTIGGKR